MPQPKQKTPHGRRRARHWLNLRPAAACGRLNLSLLPDKTIAMTQHINSQWLLDTLTDAAETLAAAIARIESDPRRAAGVLEHEIPELYAKLNFAVNTASIGPGAIDTMNHDALIAWPAGLPFQSAAEDGGRESGEA